MVLIKLNSPVAPMQILNAYNGNNVELGEQNEKRKSLHLIPIS